MKNLLDFDGVYFSWMLIDFYFFLFLGLIFRYFFKGAFHNNLNSIQLSEDLEQLGFDPDQIELISGRWTLSLSALNSSSLSQTLMVNQLLAPEWRFGMTASNKDLSTVGATFLQMKLSLDVGNGNTSQEHIGNLIDFPKTRTFTSTVL